MHSVSLVSLASGLWSEESHHADIHVCKRDKSFTLQKSALLYKRIHVRLSFHMSSQTAHKVPPLWQALWVVSLRLNRDHVLCHTLRRRESSGILERQSIHSKSWSLYRELKTHFICVMRRKKKWKGKVVTAADVVCLPVAFAIISGENRLGGQSQKLNLRNFGWRTSSCTSVVSPLASLGPEGTRGCQTAAHLRGLLPQQELGEGTGPVQPARLGAPHSPSMFPLSCRFELRAPGQDTSRFLGDNTRCPEIPESHLTLKFVPCLLLLSHCTRFIYAFIIMFVAVKVETSKTLFLPFPGLFNSWYVSIFVNIWREIVIPLF